MNLLTRTVDLCTAKQGLASKGPLKRCTSPRWSSAKTREQSDLRTCFAFSSILAVFNGKTIAAELYSTIIENECFTGSLKVGRAYVLVCDVGKTIALLLSAIQRTAKDRLFMEDVSVSGISPSCKNLNTYCRQMPTYEVQ